MYLPAPNEFTPTNLDVDKRDIAEVFAQMVTLQLASLIEFLARQTTTSHQGNTALYSLAQEGRSILGSQSTRSD